ncbi:MAG: adenylate kinase [Planctomycetota bacterium]
MTDQNKEPSANGIRVVFVGPPGVGKGTQCRRISQYFGVPHLSTGDMLRATDPDSDFGKLVRDCIDDGGFVPDYVAMRMVIQRLRQPDCANGFILDGFPRTLPQAEMFDEHLAGQGMRLECVVYLTADQETLHQRLRRRFELEGRPDDSADAIQPRLELFTELTQPLVQHYAALGVLNTVPGIGPPDEVFDSLLDSLNTRR